MTLVSYLDRSHKPVMLKDGFAQREFAYDLKNRRILERYLDAQGMPVNMASGYSWIETAWSDDGLTKWVKVFNRLGQMCRQTDGAWIIRTTTTGDGQMVEQAYLDQSGEPMRGRGLLHRALWL